MNNKKLKMAQHESSRLCIILTDVCPSGVRVCVKPMDCVSSAMCRSETACHVLLR